MSTPFKSIPDKEQQEWRIGYDMYIKNMKRVNNEPRPFSEWITDFGYIYDTNKKKKLTKLKRHKPVLII